LPQHANALWNRYLTQTGDLDGAALQPLFLSCRAAVRAKTSATAARAQSDANRRIELKDLAREYLLMAEQFLHPAGPRLIAVGGFSGSGKSTLAQALAPSVGAVPGAVVLRSDEIRKQLFGMARLQHLAAEAYDAAVSERVYRTLADQAGVILRAGHSAIVDAVYARPTDRQAIEHAAAEASAPFVGLWLDAPESTLIARVNDRRGDPSDATTKVVRLQIAQAAGVSDWQRVDASDSPATTLRFVREYLQELTTEAVR
jgi:predicted kinase